MKKYSIAAALFFVSLLIFLGSPLHILNDSNYSMMLSYQILAHHTFQLDPYFKQPLDPKRYPGIRHEGLPYQISQENGHTYYGYPPGSSILSIPFVAAASLAGYVPVGKDMIYSKRNELIIEGTFAAALMAIATVLIFYSATIYLPDSWSVIIAVGFAFGTQVWSTASRVMWTHTWTILCTALIILLLLRNKEFTGKAQILLSTLLSWLYFIRPQNVTVIALLTVFLIVRQKHRVLLLLIVGAVWLAGFIGFSNLVYGTNLPYYYTQGSQLALNLEGVAGVLVSPSRGLLIYVPSVIFVLFLVARFWTHIEEKLYLYLALSIIVYSILIVSSWPCWWGGHSYGARLLTDLAPWLALCAILGIRALQKWKSEKRPSRCGYGMVLAFGLITLGLGAFINGRGAISETAWMWNITPVDVDASDLHRWDWRYPQFLAGIIPPPATK
jgi:hypothetical protein